MSKDYNCIVDGPKSKDNYTYYSLKVKDQGKETSYTVFFPTKSKEIALFLEPSDAKEPLKGQMLFAFNKKKKPDTMTMSKSIWNNKRSISLEIILALCQL